MHSGDQIDGPEGKGGGEHRPQVMVQGKRT